MKAKKISRHLVLLALLTASALAAAGCGEDDSSTTTKSGAGGNGVDRAFVAAMIPHHESAVEMAKIARERGTSKFLKQLAEDIISSQTAEITTMRNEDKALEAAGVKLGSLDTQQRTNGSGATETGDGHMGMDEDLSTLKNARQFDREFMRMMIPHHMDAVRMAQNEISQGQDPELIALAKAIVEAQQREITEMHKRLGSGKRQTGNGGSGADYETGGDMGDHDMNGY